MIAGPKLTKLGRGGGEEKKEKDTTLGWNLLFHQFLHLCDKNKDRVIATNRA
jgi:hypothetical protein